MSENTQLSRVLDKLEEMGKDLAVISEQVKPIADIKKDVDQLKVDAAKYQGKVNSAHKRLDDMDKDIKELPTMDNQNSLSERVKSLESSRTWIVTLVLSAVVLAVIGLVIIQK